MTSTAPRTVSLEKHTCQDDWAGKMALLEMRTAPHVLVPPKKMKMKMKNKSVHMIKCLLSEVVPDSKYLALSQDAHTYVWTSSQIFSRPALPLSQ